MHEMIAKFIGEDGSMGFETGKHYRLDFRYAYNGTNGLVVEVKVVAGYTPIRYSSVSTFLENWEKVL